LNENQAIVSESSDTSKNINNCKIGKLEGKSKTSQGNNVARDLNSIETRSKRKVIQQKPFQCKICDARYCWMKLLNRHMKDFHAEYPCNKSDYIASDLSVLKKHKCDKCPFTSRCRKSLYDHKRVVHEHTLYNCDKCPFTSRDRKTLYNHKRVIHEGRTYNCTQCSFKGKRNGQLIIHRQLIHEDIIYHCDQCNFESKARHYVMSHKSSYHKGKGRKN